MTLESKSYCSRISSGRYLYLTFMYSSCYIGEAREKSFKSAGMKRAPFFASEMVLLMSSFVPSKLVAGEPESKG